MAGLEDLLGAASPFAQQLEWGVGQPILTALLAPMLSELTQDINARSPVEPLSPADLADLVVRNYLDHQAGARTAARSGVSGEDFALLVKNAGAAPDTTTLVEAFRRKILGWESSGGGLPSVLDGIREGRLADKWAPVIRALGDVPIGVADAVDAVVEGQISRERGEAIAYENGISAENFTILYNTRGNPPAPGELADMVRRGLIPVTGTGPDVLSYQQGISEGATKDKWTGALEGLLTVLPPARTVTALQRSGSITEAQALEYYKQIGLDQFTAAQYVADASHVKTAAAKDLARGDVERLYADSAIDAATATGMLTGLGYSETEAGYLLAIQDLHATTMVVDSAITRIRSYYIARKIQVGSVVTALDALEVPPAQRDKLLAAWTIARGSNVKTLTQGEITDAWAYEIIDQDEAITELQALGYTAHDAWVLLSVKNKAPLTGQPPQEPNPLT